MTTYPLLEIDQYCIKFKDIPSQILLDEIYRLRDNLQTLSGPDIIIVSFEELKKVKTALAVFEEVLRRRNVVRCTVSEKIEEKPNDTLPGGQKGNRPSAKRASRRLSVLPKRPGK